VQVRPLTIPDAFEVTPVQHVDSRGLFSEVFRSDRLSDAVGHTLSPKQVNLSVSRRGVVRGIHFADVPPGQAKYVTVSSGRIVDYVVDLRTGSPTFGSWDSVILDDVDRRAVFLAEGLGHAFIAVSEEATVSYLVSDVYSPDREHGIDPLDPEIGLIFPAEAGEPLLSDKDRDAPSLSDLVAAGSLPTWEQAHARYAELREGGAR
jgi:dTDP-4-dehydrorhamnose 3,5-epimerase